MIRIITRINMISLNEIILLNFVPRVHFSCGERVKDIEAISWSCISWLCTSLSPVGELEEPRINVNHKIDIPRPFNLTQGIESGNKTIILCKLQNVADKWWKCFTFTCHCEGFYTWGHVIVIFSCFASWCLSYAIKICLFSLAHTFTL